MISKNGISAPIELVLAIDYKSKEVAALYAYGHYEPQAFIEAAASLGYVARPGLVIHAYGQGVMRGSTEVIESCDRKLGAIAITLLPLMDL